MCFRTEFVLFRMIRSVASYNSSSFFLFGNKGVLKANLIHKRNYRGLVFCFKWVLGFTLWYTLYNYSVLQFLPAFNVFSATLMLELIGFKQIMILISSIIFLR